MGDIALTWLQPKHLIANTPANNRKRHARRRPNSHLKTATAYPVQARGRETHTPDQRLAALLIPEGRLNHDRPTLLVDLGPRYSDRPLVAAYIPSIPDGRVDDRRPTQSDRTDSALSAHPARIDRHRSPKLPQARPLTHRRNQADPDVFELEFSSKTYLSP